MANTIITKNSSTASAVPAAGSLTQGELAVNVTDKKLYTKNASGTVVEITPSYAVSAGNGGVTSVNGQTGAVTLSTGGVTSLNGQTGAITNTNLYAIGSYVMGCSLTASSAYSANATLSGSSLYNAGSAVKRNYDNSWQMLDGQALNAPAVPIAVGTGTWRCVTPTHGSGGTYSTTASGLWVRIS